MCPVIFAVISHRFILSQMKTSKTTVFHSKSCQKGKGKLSCFEQSVARRYVKVIYTGQWLTHGHFAPLGDLALPQVSFSLSQPGRTKALF